MAFDPKEYIQKNKSKKIFNVSEYIGENKERTSVEKTVRNLNLVARGASLPTTGAIAGGTFAGPIGALAGAFIIPAAEGVAGLLNYGMKGLNYLDKKAGTDYISDTFRSEPAKLVNKGLDYIFPKPETTFERSLVTGGEAVGNVASTTKALSSIANTAKTNVGKNVAEAMSTNPVRQATVAAPAGFTAQTVMEKTDSPFLGMAAGIATNILGSKGIPKRTQNIPTRETLKKLATALYKEADEAGVVLTQKPFEDFVKSLEKTLITKGLDKDITPATTAVIKRMLADSKTSRKLSDIQTLRELAGGAAGSIVPKDRMLGTMIIEQLDDFISSSGPSIMRAGNKRGLDAIKEARKTYHTMKKTEVLEEIFDSSELRADTNFSQSGLEQQLRRKIVNLADNKKKMKVFNETEKALIIKTAKGGSVQNLFRTLGKFAPTSALAASSSIFAGGGIGSLFGPIGIGVGGIGLPLAGAGSRVLSRNMSLKNINNLQDYLKLGKTPNIYQQPNEIFGTRGLLINKDENQDSNGFTY